MPEVKPPTGATIKPATNRQAMTAADQSAIASAGEESMAEAQVAKKLEDFRNPAVPLVSLPIREKNVSHGLINSVNPAIKAREALRRQGAENPSWAGEEADSLMRAGAATEVFADLEWPEVLRNSPMDPEAVAFRPWLEMITGWARDWEKIRSIVLARHPTTPESCWPGAWWWPVPFGSTARNEDLFLVLLTPGSDPIPTKHYRLLWPHNKESWRNVVLAAQWVLWRDSRRECETLYWGALLGRRFFLAEPVQGEKPGPRGGGRKPKQL